MKKFICLILAFAAVTVLSGCCSVGGGLTASPIDRLIYRLFPSKQSEVVITPEEPLQIQMETPTIIAEQDTGEIIYINPGDITWDSENLITVPLTPLADPGSAEFPAIDLMAYPYFSLCNMNWDQQSAYEVDADTWEFCGRMGDTEFIFSFSGGFQSVTAYCNSLSVSSKNPETAGTVINQDIQLGALRSQLRHLNLSELKPAYGGSNGPESFCFCEAEDYMLTLIFSDLDDNEFMLNTVGISKQ